MSRSVEGALHEQTTPAQGYRMADRLLVGYARMPEHPSKLRLLRFLGRTLNPRPILRQRNGALLEIALDDFIGWSLIRHGHYEPETLALADQLLSKRPGIFVDVGANVGLFTVALGSIPDTTVIAIEPDCSNCAQLRHNLELNGLTNVHVFNGGVARDAAIASIAKRSRNNAGSAYTQLHSLNEPDPAASSGARDWVPLLRLEQVLASITPAGPRPELITLYIEGAEFEALSGLDWNGPHRPYNVIFEHNALSESSWGSFEIMSEFFAARGYSLFTVDGKKLEGMPALEDNVWAREVS